MSQETEHWRIELRRVEDVFKIRLTHLENRLKRLEGRMVSADRRARWQAILDQHDEVARAFERARTDSTRDITQAIGEAVEGMLAANRAARALFNETEEEHRA